MRHETFLGGLDLPVEDSFDRTLFLKLQFFRFVYELIAISQTHIE